jgi:hypothetical protein
LPWTAVALRAGPIENHFALLFNRVERRIDVGQRSHPLVYRLGERTHSLIREEHALK